MLTFLTQGFKANPGLKLANAVGVHISQSDLKNEPVRKEKRETSKLVSLVRFVAAWSIRRDRVCAVSEK